MKHNEHAFEARFRLFEGKRLNRLPRDVGGPAVRPSVRVGGKTVGSPLSGTEAARRATPVAPHTACL
ncbi:hypothetical protein BCEN4_450041 [Burkholderia cenocepacia]|nr:hypothetical protein BCEN4_450041 [Burkholderia cenocepacia]